MKLAAADGAPCSPGDVTQAVRADTSISHMKTATRVPQTLVRTIGPIMIVLGVLFWTGNATRLVPLHMLLGITLVLTLWSLAVIGASAGEKLGFVALAFVWGLIVPILGLNQVQLVPGIGSTKGKKLRQRTRCGYAAVHSGLQAWRLGAIYYVVVASG
jgi:hypothetical protein